MDTETIKWTNEIARLWREVEMLFDVGSNQSGSVRHLYSQVAELDRQLIAEIEDYLAAI